MWEAVSRIQILRIPYFQLTLPKAGISNYGDFELGSKAVMKLIFSPLPGIEVSWEIEEMPKNQILNEKLP